MTACWNGVSDRWWLVLKPGPLTEKCCADSWDGKKCFIIRRERVRGLIMWSWNYRYGEKEPSQWLCFLLLLFITIVQMEFLSWEIRIAFPEESQLRQSRATKPTVHTGYFDGSFLADGECWESWWSVLACSLVAVETDSWCAPPTALWADDNTESKCIIIVHYRHIPFTRAFTRYLTFNW